jgi:hypothetical protein
MQKRLLGNSGLEVSAISAASIELTPSDLSEIESAVSGIPVQGERYPQHLQQRVDR